MVSASDLVNDLRTPASKLEGLNKLKALYRPYICPMINILDEIPPSARLFDIGCGSGTLLYLAAQRRSVETAHGYDVSPEAVNASKAFASVGNAFRVSYRGAEDQLPSLTGYTAITMIDVLHHIPLDKQHFFIEQLISRLDVGSKLIIADIERSHFISRWCNQAHDLILARQWVYPRAAEDIRRLLESCLMTVAKPVFKWDLWYLHYVITAEKR